MKIALLGYGKMGREIEKIALQRNHSVILTIDIDNQNQLTPDNLKKADVAIDFSTPDSAYQNIMKCFEADVPIVCGTTGWLEKFDKVTAYCKNNGKTFFYASNYSLGVNIFFDLNRKLARMMNRFGDYDVSIEEIHHIHKLDKPSGTAITLAEGIIGEIDRKKHWELDKKSDKDCIPIYSIREGEVPGTHNIKYDSPIDSIEIVHTAKNRKGLALGAILAAEFIQNKTGYFSMSDIMNTE